VPPFKFSRFQFTAALNDIDRPEILFLTDRERFVFRELPDTRTHIAREGDTLFTLAHRFFRGLDRPSGFWWIIADFQPDPIHDPTISIGLGRTLFIPSLRTVTEEIFSEKRTEEATP
jgi:hypothetical protein